MSEWWTYTLGDFLLFSPRTYYRLLELYNVAIWPGQLVGVAIGFAIVGALATRHPQRGRLVAGLLAVCWAWIAWRFHQDYYAQINWAASWFAAAFALQASLLVALGVLAGRIIPPVPHGGGWRIVDSLIVVVVIAYPLLASLGGRPWTSAETFGTAADPTAIGTIAALGRCRGRMRWLLLIVPLLWCAVAVATLWAMERWEAIVVAGATLTALAAAMRERRQAEPRTMG